MKKRVLNLSLLMLLSTSFNAFGMLASLMDANKANDKVIQSVTEKINQAVVELAHNSESGSAQKIANDAIAAVEKLDDSKLAKLSEAAKLALAKSLTVLRNKFSQLKSSAAANSLSKIVEKTTNLKNILTEFVQKNPKTAAMALVGTAGTVYGVHKLLKSKGIIHDATEHTRGGAAAIGEASEVEHHGLSPELQATVDAEIQARGGDVNSLVDGRRLLGKYSEGPGADLNAVKYLLNKQANHLLPADDQERSLLIFPAAWGKVDILEFLLSLGGFTEQNKNDALNYAIAGLNANNFDEETFNRIKSLLE